MTAGETIVEQFRVFGLDRDETIVFEQTNDLGAAIPVVTGSRVYPDPMESQVLIRQNIDDEGISVVYVDGSHGSIDDVATMTAAIEKLTECRDRLSRLLGCGS